MDGLLIDSEPLWRKAEIAIFGSLGISISEDDCRETRGMRVDEVVSHWAYKFPQANLPQAKTAEAIVEAVGKLIDQEGTALPGVYEVIALFEKKNIPLAIASASSSILIHKMVERLELQTHFSQIISAEHMSYGKPHPEVFLKAAAALKIKPEECLVFEDSIYGVIAGKAAKMKVVAVPDQENFTNTAFCIADAKLSSLEAFTPEIWEALDTL